MTVRRASPGRARARYRVLPALLRLFLVLVFLLVAEASLLGCGGSSHGAPESSPLESVAIYTPARLDDPDAGDDAAAAALVPATTLAPAIALDGGYPAITAIEISPLVLVPSFSPTIHDYYVRCVAGDNPLVLTVTDASGTTTRDLDLFVDQAIVVGDQNWIRCLPPDFPQIVTTSPLDGGGPTPGYYLTNSQTYAMILDTHATPVWYARGTDIGDLDSLQANTLSLMPNWTAVYGTNPASEFQVHSLATNATTNVQAVGTPTDAHEFRQLPNGDYLLFSYFTQTGVDLEGLSTYGEDEDIANCEIQEISPAGNLVWSWLASDHVDPVTESLESQTNAVGGQAVVDVFHCNSIDVDSSGNLLVSLRYENAVYYIEKSTGQVLWKLGGTPTNKDGATPIQVVGDPEGTFSMQHDARFMPNGDVTLFDDHGNATGVARGVEYALDITAQTATVVFQFLGTEQSEYEGSFRREADGESVIGWGGHLNDLRVLTEVDPNGNDVFDISFAVSTSPYRGIKVPLSALDIDLLRLTAAQW